MQDCFENTNEYIKNKRLLYEALFQEVFLKEFLFIFYIFSPYLTFLSQFYVVFQLLLVLFLSFLSDLSHPCYLPV